MAKQKDDLEAVRTIVDVLQPFDTSLQRRIVRWAAEKLDLSLPLGAEPVPDAPLRRPPAPRARRPHARASAPASSALQAFVSSKRPRNDTEFAATLAYYTQAVASAGHRKPGINASDLVAACDALSRKRPPVPGQTLRNARAAGVLTSKKPGVFTVSPAGEKLILRTLPRDAKAASAPAPRRGHRGRRGGAKR